MIKKEEFCKFLTILAKWIKILDLGINGTKLGEIFIHPLYSVDDSPTSFYLSDGDIRNYSHDGLFQIYCSEGDIHGIIREFPIFDKLKEAEKIVKEIDPSKKPRKKKVKPIVTVDSIILELAKHHTVKFTFQDIKRLLAIKKRNIPDEISVIDGVITLQTIVAVDGDVSEDIPLYEIADNTVVFKELPSNPEVSVELPYEIYLSDKYSSELRVNSHNKMTLDMKDKPICAIPNKLFINILDENFNSMVKVFKTDDEVITNTVIVVDNGELLLHQWFTTVSLL